MTEYEKEWLAAMACVMQEIESGKSLEEIREIVFTKRVGA